MAYDVPYAERGLNQALVGVGGGLSRTLTEQVQERITQLEIKLADEKELLKLLTEEPKLGRAWDLMLRRQNY